MRFQLFGSFVTCPDGYKLERIGGTGDGGKWICGIKNLVAPCAIFSMGSNGDYSFEKSIPKVTSCQLFIHLIVLL